MEAAVKAAMVGAGSAICVPILTRYLHWLAKKKANAAPVAGAAIAPSALKTSTTDKVARISSIMAACASITVAVMLLLLVFGGFPQRDVHSILGDFPRQKISLQQDPKKWHDAQEATNILHNNQTKQEVTVKNHTYKQGNVFYVNKRQPTQFIIVSGEPSYVNPDVDHVFLEVNTQLMVRGFDAEGKRALVQCNIADVKKIWNDSALNKTLLFYPLE